MGCSCRTWAMRRSDPRRFRLWPVKRGARMRKLSEPSIGAMGHPPQPTRCDAVPGACGVRDQRPQGRTRRQTRGRVHFSKQNLSNGPFARDRTPLSIVCLAARGTKSPGTNIKLGRGLTNADL
jgi:hypothetical protein